MVTAALENPRHPACIMQRHFLLQASRHLLPLFPWALPSRVCVCVCVCYGWEAPPLSLLSLSALWVGGCGFRA